MVFHNTRRGAVTGRLQHSSAFVAMLPLALQASFERHHAHLAQLVTSLRAAGIEEAQVEASVNSLMVSYQAELMAVLKSWMKADCYGF